MTNNSVSLSQPSLPKRLRFNRQHSDLTPKERNSAAKTLLFGAPQSEPMGPPPLPTPINTSARDKEALEAANVEIRNKTEVIADYEQQIEELKISLHQANQQNDIHIKELSEKDQRINEVEHELNDDNEGIEMLKEISQKSIAKIETLENEIRLILRNHENEIDFLIRTNTRIELECDRTSTEKKLLNEEVVVLKKEVLYLNDELKQTKQALIDHTDKLSAQNELHKRLVVENIKLLDQIAAIKRDADNDMIAYVEESQNILRQLENVRTEKEKIATVLAFNENVIADLRDEVANKDIEMDSVRDELRDNFNADLKSVTKKHEQQIATLKELNEMKIKEIESIFVLERTKSEKSQSDLVKQLRAQLECSSDTAEEKIRISEIQLEQRLKAMESSIEQSIDHEKQLWKSEIDKCQKIAETEIMQCEFEKQDLKALLDAANELMREKDDKIEEMQVRLSNEFGSFVKCRDELAAELNEVRKECTRAMTDKYNYQLTLNNTRSTVTILMERLTKSDGDVEILKQELESSNEELAQLHKEMEEYRKALTSLRGSSLALERELKEKETAFDRLMATSEGETLNTVNKIGKLFNDKIEENIGKYVDMYNELKLKYDARENYILDMKALLDEFASGIELARIELDTKDEKLVVLQTENKNIKLENMTYKFKCEQFEKYDLDRVVASENSTDKFSANVSSEEDSMVPEKLMADIIIQLEKDADLVVGGSINMGLYSDEDKIAAENSALKDKLAEKSRQIELLQEMVQLEGCHATENVQLKKQVRIFETIPEKPI